MRIALLLLPLPLLVGCMANESASTVPESSGPLVMIYEDLGSHPRSVQTLLKPIVDIPADSSIDEYQKILEETDLVEVPYEHFKDYEHYWRVHSPDGSPRSYIVAGGFAHSTDHLSYTTINVVEGGNWKTLWSVQHDPNSMIAIRLRGVDMEKEDNKNRSPNR